MIITKDQIDDHYGKWLEQLHSWKMGRLREGFDPEKVNTIYKADKKEILEEHYDMLKAFAKMDLISKKGT